ncbi:hypothetical protein [Acidithiobacillus ferrooxidans]|uniref:hypothetical protein n=1 Tax=Acidithiobacillus ferrooxidans TaxID=920 RepID=UPI000B11AAAB|nr:hypothetical protein [Acidithiobacillus ferrooxidans]
MLKNYSKYRLRQAVAAAIFVSVSAAMPLEQAYAVTAGMNWQTQQTFATPNNVQALYNSLNTDKIYVDNNLGGAVALVKLSASQVQAIAHGGNTFDMPWNSPVVFANYDPGTLSGTIFVIRLIKQPNGQGIIEMAQFTPTMGNVFTQDFENTNPFWQFIPGQNGNGAGPNAGSFVSITPAAFNTAVGLVMQHVQSGIGWIAAANTTSHMSTSSSSSLFTASVTHKETANTAPVWTAVLPEGAAPGQQEGYLLPVPGSSASTPAAAVASLNVSQDAQTIGGLTNATAQFGNNYLGQLEVNGGYVYVPAGAGASLPTAAFQSFLHSTTKSGFTGLFFDIILAVVTAVTFGAAAPLAGLAITGIAAAGAGAAVGFVTGMLFDVVANGGPGFTNIQEHLVGGNCAGSNQKCLTGPPVAMNAAYTSAQAFDGYQEGYSKSDTNPTSTNGNQWDYLPQTASEVEQAPQNVQGGFGQGYQQTTLTPAQAQKGETLSDLANQAQKTGSGYINFGSNTGGITGAGVP